MTGEGVKIAADRAHVGGKMRHPLRPVDQHLGPVPVRQVRDSLHVVDGSEAVGQMHDRDDLRLPAGQDLLVLLQPQFAAVVHRDDAQLGAGLLAHHLPGDDVGMMLHGGDHHFVARF